jgi:hypothetical protein
MDLLELIAAVPQTTANEFASLYESDKFENLVTRKNYLYETDIDLAQRFSFTSEMMMHDACVVTERNQMLNPGETPHRAVFSIGLDYNFDHPEIVLTNGFLGEDEGKFEEKYADVVRQLAKQVMAGNTLTTDTDHSSLIDDVSLQVPVIFREATFEDLAHWQMAFDFLVDDFYMYFTFDQNKIPRNMLMPLVLDLTTYRYAE